MVPRLEAQVDLKLDRKALLMRQRGRHQELIEAESVLPGITDCIKEAKKLGLKRSVRDRVSCGWNVRVAAVARPLW